MPWAPRYRHAARAAALALVLSCTAASAAIAAEPEACGLSNWFESRPGASSGISTKIRSLASVGRADSACRVIAEPFVVGYLDAGYGGEGLATFSGINSSF
jgi:hypothetical protein